MVVAVETDTVSFEGRPVDFSHSVPISAEAKEFVQDFIDSVPTLKVGETFYLGMWPIKLVEQNEKLKLCEFDFRTNEYSERLEQSLRLWNEQYNVCSAMSVEWQSISLEQFIYYSPSAFLFPIRDTIEGIRDEPTSSESSGWFLYTLNESEAKMPFKRATLQQLLKQYNLPILRFLGLSTDWSFNLQDSGESHVWHVEQEKLH